jgi:replicative DNA helicase
VEKSSNNAAYPIPRAGPRQDNASHSEGAQHRDVGRAGAAQNIEAEASVLGSILIEKDAIIKIADVVTADDFYVDRHGTIFAAIMDLYEQRAPIDIVSLSNKLREASELDSVGGSAYITELTTAVPTAAHVVHYASIVAHKAMLRRLIAAASNITQLGYDEQTPLDQLLDRAEQTVFDVSQKNLKQNFIPSARSSTTHLSASTTCTPTRANCAACPLASAISTTCLPAYKTPTSSF